MSGFTDEEIEQLTNFFDEKIINNHNYIFTIKVTKLYDFTHLRQLATKLMSRYSNYEVSCKFGNNGCIGPPGDTSKIDIFFKLPLKIYEFNLN
jgi:hypothetical protein